MGHFLPLKTVLKQKCCSVLSVIYVLEKYHVNYLASLFFTCRLALSKLKKYIGPTMSMTNLLLQLIQSLQFPIDFALFCFHRIAFSLEDS